MDMELFRKVRSELARQGGLARAKAMTAEERRKSATKASKGRSEGDDCESQDQETKIKSVSRSARLCASEVCPLVSVSAHSGAQAKPPTACAPREIFAESGW